MGRREYGIGPPKSTGGPGMDSLPKEEGGAFHFVVMVKSTKCDVKGFAETTGFKKGFSEQGSIPPLFQEAVPSIMGQCDNKLTSNA